MKWSHPRTRLILVLVATLVAIATLLARLDRVSRVGNRQTIIWSRNEPPGRVTSANASERSTENNSAASPAFPSPAASIPSATNQASPAISGAPPPLIVPVAGVRTDQLGDSFT